MGLGLRRDGLLWVVFLAALGCGGSTDGSTGNDDAGSIDSSVPQDAARADAGDSADANASDGPGGGGDADASTQDTADARADSGVSFGTAVAVGAAYSCALLSDGAVECWGGGLPGALVTETYDGSPATHAYSPTPTKMPSYLAPASATAIAAGPGALCSLGADGSVLCGAPSNTGVYVGPFPDAVAEVAAGGQLVMCARLESGEVDCTTLNSGPPSKLAGVSGATDLSLGDSHGCAVLAGGSVWCWGDNTSGELGSGTTSSTGGTLANPIATAVTGLTGATAVSAGSGHTCARLSNGEVWCWGDNSKGQLGDGTFASSAAPVQVAGVAGATAVAAGYGFTCALVGGGSVSCWGDDSLGQLGSPSVDAGADAGPGSPVPVMVPGVTHATAIAVSRFAIAGARVGHACALLDDGTVRCWGANDDGRLGDGTTRGSATPVAVTCRPGTCDGICKPACAACSAQCGTPACCGSACETTHTTGTGQSFYDCEPAGTADEPEAFEACSLALLPSGLTRCADSTPSCGDAGTLSATCSCSQTFMYPTLQSSAQCWVYAGAMAGRTYESDTGCTPCPPASGGQPWN
jgi:alpha-tubulin suppressor-like RCC1 family protein